MFNKISTTSFACAIVLAAIFFFHGVGEADSFPFRSIDVGDKLPAITVRDLGSQQDVGLESFSGKPLLMLFFGADIPAKKKRATKTLKSVHGIASFMEERGVSILVVNAQDDSADVIKDVMATAGFLGNGYTDIDRQVYGALGIFVMPSVLLVAADGTVAAGMGYSRDLGKRLKGEIAVMLGEKTRTQVEEELHPKMVEKSAEEKGARRHFNLGLTMIGRGQPQSAMREFKKAVALAPDMGKAHAYLGCLQLDDGQLDEAKASVAKGLEFDPEFVEGQICQARIKAKTEDLDGAVEDLTNLMLRNSRNDKLHYVLGGILEVKADHVGAMREYRKAYELLQKKSLRK